MKILGLECSAAAAGAAIVSDGKLLSEAYLNIGLTHSETLMPLIDTVLNFAKLDISDIDLFAVSNGPGSFTGLRIGVGTIKGLAMGQNKPVCGVSSLKALCYNVKNAEGLIAPIMDARRGEVYNGLYKWDGDTLCEIEPMRAIPVDKLAIECFEGATFVGDGAAVHKARLRELLGDKAKFAQDAFIYQRASSVAMAAINEKEVNAEELLPVYIRKPQAERELENKIKGENKE
ncbi:MAG: tRNA (adenosine(37)-N6)-threonylcarbamoyltransferase complex dimerization subunit type 1 TsaB [Clostridia bacterium]|nr:tRNA (adenosine(37)-N6)-threonylcarbamoyltransferase complex dimerization subunit type 1 TsaB [Clostridia bacterium]